MTPVVHFQPNPPPFSSLKVYWWGLFKYWKDPIPISKVKMTDSLASYTSNCNFKVKVYNRSLVLRRLLALNRWKWKFWNFVIFAYNTPWPSLFYDFDLSFLKILLKITFDGHLQDKVYLSFSTVFFKNLQPIPHF